MAAGKKALEEIINDYQHSVIEYYYNSNISKERRDELLDKYDDKFEVIRKDLEVLEIIIKKDVEIKYVKMAIEAEKKENNPKLFPAVGFYNKGQRNVDKRLSDDEFELLREKLEKVMVLEYGK